MFLEFAPRLLNAPTRSMRSDAFSRSRLFFKALKGIFEPVADAYASVLLFSIVISAFILCLTSSYSSEGDRASC